MATPDSLDAARRDAVLDRLGFTEPPPADRAGLTDVYAAWCRSVPFDNVRKLIALHGGASGPLPGLGADDFFDAWLAHGTGGTCWPTAHALHSLLLAVGFESRRVVASMYDQGEPSHGTTIVTIDGAEHLVDTSMLTGVPLPLDPSGLTTTSGAGLVHTAEPVAEGWLFGFGQVRSPEPLPCRTLAPDAVGRAIYDERYEVSRTWSPFNTHVRVMVHRPGGTVSFAGGHRYQRAVADPEAAVLDELTDDEQLRALLVDDVGYSEQIVEELFSVWTPPEPA